MAIWTWSSDILTGAADKIVNLVGVQVPHTPTPHTVSAPCNPLSTPAELAGLRSELGHFGRLDFSRTFPVVQNSAPPGTPVSGADGQAGEMVEDGHQAARHRLAQDCVQPIRRKALRRPGLRPKPSP